MFNIINTTLWLNNIIANTIPMPTISEHEMEPYCISESYMMHCFRVSLIQIKLSNFWTP